MKLGNDFHIQISRVNLLYLSQGRELKIPIENGGGIIGVLLSELLQWNDGKYVKPTEKNQIKVHIQNFCTEQKIDIEFK